MARKPLTNEQFEIKSKALHGDKYDYSLVEYVDGQTHVILICKIHGQFKVKPATHLNRHHKQGCPDCGRIIRSHLKSEEKAVEEFQAVHGDKYDYSEINYTGMRNNINVYCKTHKTFFHQRGYSHKAGHGCPQCGLETVIEKRYKNKGAANE